MLYEAWKQLKDLWWLCQHYGLQIWVISQTFYDGVTQSVRFTIDLVAGGTLTNETKDEAYNLIEEMALNNFQWSSERSQPKRIGGKLVLDAITLLFAKVDVGLKVWNV